ncbi:ribonuclease J [Microvirga arsenatis]|uniref:MBL fold metallo-hydrolase n=1 Tax=Microvirga arsenatis TaxID=2692265 RepID=A0ABW9YU17_9HYPH|nr:ribonuclease J [Microvirga arsenatis]NBJ12436.1 MBL fold metallo-hydrolase [Microvirga arsenatis]NBJ23312.1 MBL fold metallo-hydrolase [Microvirga arsenatis]
MASQQDELVFLPLGGLGEIGMNAALYGFGPEEDRQWILVDCGMGFGSEENLPGIDLVYPDLRFIEEERHNLLGIFITHAHEDHIGALVEMWPRLRAPVYATKFAIGLLETRRLSEPNAPKVDLNEIVPGQRLKLGPFEIEYVPVAHSIPESNALAIRTPHGLVVHTGDWKLDSTPYLGSLTSEETFRALGDEGVLALVCDSTNVVREGTSPSEADVSRNLAKLIEDAPHRVAVTTFASNVARIRSVAEAARECGREVVVVGRAMDRVVEVAKECGYLDDLPEFRSTENFGYMPRDKVVAILTGSQGEPRAALARIAQDEHPDIALSAGDRVIFSSRAIPGNEKAVGAIINGLIERGIEVITDRTELVHVSGHPRRGELAQMYQWTRPRIAIPAHGEPLHLSEHAKFARQQGVKEVVQAKNGTLVRLAPGPAEIIDNIPAGRLYKDGNIVIGAGERALPERRKLAFAGIVTVAIAIDDRGELVGDPVIDAMGLPDKNRQGREMADIIADTVADLLDGLPKAKRRDSEAVENAVHRAVRAAVNQEWGKKPACHVLVIEA